MTPPAVPEDARLRLHRLHVRPDRDEYVVGRVEIGQFVAVPAVAVAAIRLLDEGLRVAEVRERLRSELEHDIDVSAFAANLVDLGFVAEIDGRAVPGPEPIAATWPWLRPRHVRWLMAPIAPVLVLAIVVAAAATAIALPHTVPGLTDLTWSQHTSLVLAGNVAIIWTVILLHEIGHLATARAVDVPGRLTLGTRLQFLVAQTDVTGVWAAPRRVRLTVYLAGMAVALSIASTALVARAAVGVDGPGRLLGAICLIALVSLPGQLLVFARTDMYFVLQDLTGCRNLYADGGAYVRYWARRALTPRRLVPPDPTAALPKPERRAVHAYAVILLLGTVACLTVAATVTIPLAAILLARAAGAITAGATVTARVDGVLTIIAIGGVWALWTRTWWRRHGPKITSRWARRHRTTPTPRRPYAGAAPTTKPREEVT